MTDKPKLRRRVYAGLVGTQKIREVATDDELTAALQELPHNGPNSALLVPQSDSDAADRLRRLMLMDAAITPPKMPGAHGLPTWAVDTGRMMRAARRLKMPRVGTRVDGDEWAKLLRAYHGIDGYQQAAQAVRMGLVFDDRFRSASENYSRRAIDTWADVIKLARELAQAARNESTQPAPGNAEKWEALTSPESESESESESKPDLGEAAPKSQADTVTLSKDAGFGNSEQFYTWRPRLKASDFSNAQYGKAAPGKIVNPTSPDKLAMQSLRKRGYRRRPELEGAVPSAWHRFHLDQKLFKGAPIKGGCKGRGTILVDLSGSMSWTAGAIRALIEVVPECTVLGYAGMSGIGRLVLLADRGMAATEAAIRRWNSETGLGGNCIDAPALELLARMPTPRVWVSDGGVTGGHDARSSYVEALCKQACRTGNITRVRSGENAAMFLKGDKSAAETKITAWG